MEKQSGEIILRFENIESIVDGDGTVTIGRHGSIPCAATIEQEYNHLVTLVKKSNESFVGFLERLDSAIEEAWEEEKCIDEIND